MQKVPYSIEILHIAISFILSFEPFEGTQDTLREESRPFLTNHINHQMAELVNAHFVARIK
jgi:hypothetical protein